MTIYYVKNGGSDSADGLSDANAWASCSKVTNYGGYGTGDIVLFKCGDTWSNQFVDMLWGGSAGNHATIGAYYGSGTRGVSGEKPIIDGGYVVGSGTDPGLMSVYHGLISMFGAGLTHQKVENMHVRNVWGMGIRANNPDSIVTGCEVHDCILQCIIAEDEGYRTEVSYNRVYNGSRKRVDGVSDYGKPPMMSSAMDGWTHHNILGPTWGEGLNASDGGTNTDWSTDSGKLIVEDNTFFGIQLTGFYLVGGRYMIARRNIVVGANPSLKDTTGATSADYCWTALNNRRWARDAFYFANESRDSSYPYEQCRVYNNLIAGVGTGFIVQGTTTYGNGFRDSMIAHNTIIDCARGITMFGSAASGSVIKNNLFVAHNPGLVAATGLISSGITYAKNLWFESPGISVPNDIIDAALVARTTGWLDITSIDAFASTDFHQLTGSPGIGTGALMSEDGLDVDYYGTQRVA